MRNPVLLIDHTVHGESRAGDFQRSGYDLLAVSSVEDATTEMLRENIHGLIWHLGSTYFKGSAMTTMLIPDAIGYLENECQDKVPPMERRFGVSGAGDFRSKAESTGWFIAVTTWDGLTQTLFGQVGTEPLDPFERAKEAVHRRHVIVRLKTIAEKLGPLHLALQRSADEARLKAQKLLGEEGIYVDVEPAAEEVKGLLAIARQVAAEQGDLPVLFDQYDALFRSLRTILSKHL